MQKNIISQPGFEFGTSDFPGQASYQFNHNHFIHRYTHTETEKIILEKSYNDLEKSYASGMWTYL